MGTYLSEPITHKNTRVGSSPGMSFYCSEMQGWRRTMEDSAICEIKLPDGNALFGVFDGHGGHEVSALVKLIFVKRLCGNQEYKLGNYAQALSRSFADIDAYIFSQQGEDQLFEARYQNGCKIKSDQKISLTTGCTANVILITPTKIYIANAGDSRSALYRQGTTIDLSYDHKPQLENEIRRIENAGGSIVMGRVNGGLNLTRALGDFRYKANSNLSYEEQMITCKPDVREVDRHPSDQFILMGCDGIWEKYVDDSHGLLQKTKKLLSRAQQPTKTLQILLDDLIATQTPSGIGCDNMTCILIRFK